MKDLKLIFPRLAFVLIVLAVTLLGPAIAQAATFGFFLDKENPIIGDTLTADLKIDSEDVSINFAQATIKFPSNILRVDSLSKTDSIFDFWLTQPSFDNTLGQISFGGGSTTNGFSGKSLQALRIKFKVIGNGEASLVFSDTAISAADGSGSNVLSVSKSASFSVLSKSELSKIAPATISREPVPADKAPAKPILAVSLYPDPNSWYNLSSDFSASWNLPGDIISVATSLNKIPDSAPAESEGLFNNKVFKALNNGIWYLHVRFKNNIGWGATTHYRIAIDSVPPLQFTVNVVGGEFSNNPTPTIQYKESKDQFSGILEYAIKIDSEPEIKTQKTEYTLPLLPPGKHLIKVAAKDKAGNITESTTEIEVLPIASPEILFVNPQPFVGEGGLAVNGIALANVDVLLNLKTSTGESVLQRKTEANENGVWSMSMNDPLKKGDYYIEATARDSRGALSLPVKSKDIIVRDRPIITLFGLEITQKWFTWILFLALIATFIAGFLLRRLTDEKRHRRIIITERDISAILSNIKKDIEGIMEEHKAGAVVDPSVETKVNFILKKIDDSIKNTEKYILDNVEEIE